MLKGKSILFIAPIFHDYHRFIKMELEKLGACVYFFPERNYGIQFKIINNFYKKQLCNYQEKHYNEIIKRINGDNFDYLFVIRGFMMNESFIRQFKKLNPHSKTIMYQWDSNKTNPFENIIDLFDSFFSFDYIDCDNFKKIKYLPLFYTNDILEYQPENTISIYDFLLVGTYIPERYIGLLKFKKYIENASYKIKEFVYVPITSFIKEILKGIKLDIGLLSFCRMSREEYVKLLWQSKIIVDISNKGQTGMAMRIIEALALRKKIVTSNKNIIREPFYNETQIYIFDPDDPFVTPEFIESTPDKLISVLSIHDWLITIFNENEG